jgi:hypothetical protein
VKLPEDDEDGALPRDQVLQVLELSQVTVVRLDDRFVLMKDRVSEMQIFPDKIPRQMVRYLARKFGINPLHFYYPRQLMH